MSLHVIWLVILLSFVYKTNGDGVWEFGINSKNSMIILQKSGTINLFEKYTQVPLTVERCMKLMFVRVQVYNILSTPQVLYTENTKTVHIVYKLSQSSTSQYEIIGKGEQACHCDKKKVDEENSSNELDADDGDNLDADENGSDDEADSCESETRTEGFV